MLIVIENRRMLLGKINFLNQLRTALSGHLSEQRVATHVKYYEEYIDREVRNGRNEVQVLDELGDPKLIAKSILTAESFKTGATGSAQANQSGYAQSNYNQSDYGSTNQSEYNENTYDEKTYKKEAKKLKWKIYIGIVLVVLVVITVIVLAFSLIWAVLPIIFAAAIIMFLVNLFTKK